MTGLIKTAICRCNRTDTTEIIEDTNNNDEVELAKAKDEENLKVALSKAYQLCDKAVSKGILHKNTASRKKSRLTIAVNKLMAQ